MTSSIHKMKESHTDGAEPRDRSKGVKKSSLLWYAVPFGIAGILVTIAILQYHWINELNREMEVRVHSHLESLMREWNLDLYGNLSAICVALQVGPDSGAHDLWNDYLLRYAAWSHKEAAQGLYTSLPSNPALIRSVYIWETSRKPKPNLLLLNPETKKIEITNYSPAMAPLLRRLQQRSKNVAVALRAWERDNSSGATQASTDRSRTSRSLIYPLEGWQFDENIPAIVHPLVDHYDPAISPTGKGYNIDAAVDWIVIVLDSETIKNKILPDLATQYFGGDKGLEYKLAVVSIGKPSRVIYSSDPNFPASSGNSDNSVMNIFGRRVEITDDQFKTGITGDDVTGSRGKSTLSGSGWFPVIQYEAGADPWVLVLQGRSGSLEAAVKQVWRTNLATGVVFLLLLAANVFLVVLALQRLQHLTALQMNFVASVSHELRTPLTVIISAAENITDGVVKERSEIKEHGEIITGQSQLLMDLVDRILFFAANRAGKHLQMKRSVPVNEIFERVEHNVAGLLQAFSVKLEKTIRPEVQAVNADPAWLCLCLQTLISNAVKFRGNNNWLGLMAELRKTGDGVTEICISVQDRGVGIKESELKKIFEPFYRSPEALENQFEGTGLGLTFAQRIAVEMGGRLTVTSQVGVGSTFAVHLPTASQRVEELLPREPVGSVEHE